jgi:nicotinamidase-related amidase
MTNQIHPYEPLTSQNAALILVDHQIGLMTGVRDYSTGELKHNVVALAKAAKSLKLPIVVTTTARDSMWGPTFPELVEALPGHRDHRPFVGQRIRRCTRGSRNRGDRPQETDFRWHLARSLCSFPGDHSRG